MSRRSNAVGPSAAPDDGAAVTAFKSVRNVAVMRPARTLHDHRALTP
jgi:hypothetical protein